MEWADEGLEANERTGASTLDGLATRTRAGRMDKQEDEGGRYRTDCPKGKILQLKR